MSLYPRPVDPVDNRFVEFKNIAAGWIGKAFVNAKLCLQMHFRIPVNFYVKKDISKRMWDFMTTIMHAPVVSPIDQV